MNVKNVFGIDLGTTYSCVAQIDGQEQAVVLRNFEGAATTPSVVYFEDEKTAIVGEEAKNQLEVEPEKTVCFVKREIGVDASYDKLNNRFPYHYDPTEISAFILKKVVKDANCVRESEGLEPINDVVITCPAYFGTKERMQTKQAGIAAGLNVLAIINEPVAAAISYGVKTDKTQTVLVYDLGGGTFDVSVIKITRGKIQVVVTGGDHHLGGADWDLAVSQFLLDEFNKANGTEYSLDSDVHLKNTLFLQAEKAKKSLSAKERAMVNFQYEGKSARIALTREKFDELTEGLLEQTLSYVESTIEDSKKKGVETFDQVLLVGGSSRMPQVKAAVDKRLNCDARLTDPDECVAKGAAIFAMNKSYEDAIEAFENGETDDCPDMVKCSTTIVNVTSKSYGVGIIPHNVENLIMANTPLPTEGRGVFCTVYDNQPAVRVDVWESNETEKIIDQDCAECLDDGLLPLTKKWPAGTRVEVVFKIDSEGLMYVWGKLGNDIKEYCLKITGVKDDKEMEKCKKILAEAEVN
ncbi:Hsp70 family protein [Hallerella succinigenes]|uniref:Molecular chaperone DnaK (HSP70) n=2 Tax=Fibrobacteraceae TaxID=204431 RepID=A0A2M9A9C0_9BACT|nr:Hsp70 family protein [Hallerella succinigenes]PJJ42309.1 molecular chaperone DnaK (HSP70) [Hallerella succinigenes]